jgi:hypothetical protein
VILFATILELSWINTSFLFFPFALLSFFQVFAAHIVSLFLSDSEAQSHFSSGSGCSGSEISKPWMVLRFFSVSFWTGDVLPLLARLVQIQHSWFTANQGRNQINGRGLEYPSWTEIWCSIVFSIPKSYWQSIMHILLFNKPFCFSSEIVPLQ